MIDDERVCEFDGCEKPSTFAVEKTDGTIRHICLEHYQKLARLGLTVVGEY